MSERDSYKSLIRKFYRGNATVEEIDLLESLKDDIDFLAAWEEVWNDDSDILTSREDNSRAAITFENIKQDSRIHFKSNTSHVIRSPFNLKFIVRIAAVLACAAFLGLLWIKSSSTDQLTKHELANQSKVKPGSDRASIILEDGSIIELDQMENDTVINTDQFSIVKSGDGQISYKLNPSNNTSTEIVYNTILTPKGGQYKLELPDGTAVWLNAETKLKYPITFHPTKREVQLEGEAYFDVAKEMKAGHSIPFIVKTGGQLLEVLGTQFNISSYKQEIITTLIEGSVRLDFLDTKIKSKVLKPNDQSVFNASNNSYKQTKVDPFNYIAWKNGNFAFDNASLVDVMASVSRWYDIDVIYEGSFSDVYFTGSISRYAEIEKLLATIAITGDFKYRIKERKVYIMK